ncbi:nucleoside-diphosphate-sugar epimerase [Saccharothrix saharensis]|uniref:Nucleoside-diphosphate-sugar epimerase n=1 Tax=Saccharothrix saharensis TaxID=571190 RepID=A0A543JRC1_9PSEU|nr:NAD(P)-dependent oxidoreductase [Saccharothrix saharensis]TQM85368.1 nucleoside-diphosphate-sugar epimerase [Saccharothrix saharensis]
MTVLVTGASGFVGSAVLRRLALSGRAVRVLVHEQEPDVPRGTEVVRGDVTDPRSLRGIGDGVDVVLHLASYVGTDPQRCAAVNERGTRHLLAEVGARPVVRLGTAAVYGSGPFTAATERITPQPASVRSATRLAGERLVLAAGGVVLRPYFVFGAGDRWVVPGLLDVLERVGGVPGDARLSLTDVRDLARWLVALATPDGPRGAFLACPRTPTGLVELASAVTRTLGLAVPPVVDPDEAARRWTAAGGTRHHLDLFAVDHWFDGSALHDRLGGGDRGFAAAFADHAAWYRTALQRSG